MDSQKELHIRLPLPLYEEFFRLFPARGERTEIVRRLIYLAVKLAKGKPDIISELEQQLTRRL